MELTTQLINHPYLIKKGYNEEHQKYTGFMFSFPNGWKAIVNCTYDPLYENWFNDFIAYPQESKNYDYITLFAPVRDQFPDWFQQDLDPLDEGTIMTYLQNIEKELPASEMIENLIKIVSEKYFILHCTKNGIDPDSHPKMRQVYELACQMNEKYRFDPKPIQDIGSWMRLILDIERTLE
ncbi:hypothetical protein [Thermoactinomyces sp. DSM 45892]|uniref:hypothetical protein n=1 Tax=Thermoactinomyces sp. DSM 45892 TaxID=1882753 RepID=UPI0008978AC2|nr:hypothetical protein [Thermoactinomyces sp. DSM 45892]SDY86952.1 hypothetical protein SAMN05444416_109123 [Thermoactinomyces sp. DSM 45892]